MSGAQCVSSGQAAAMLEGWGQAGASLAGPAAHLQIGKPARAQTSPAHLPELGTNLVAALPTLQEQETRDGDYL